MTNKGTKKWEVRPRQRAANSPQPAITAPKPSKPVDLTRNRELAFLGKMSLSHARSQKLLQNSLLNPGYDQNNADKAVLLVEACAEISGVDISKVGNWDALAHGLAVYLIYFNEAWLCERSGFIKHGEYGNTRAVVSMVFGDRFVGRDVILQLDNYGKPMILKKSVV